MIGVLVVTHGDFGESLIAAATHTLGRELPRVAHVGVGGSDNPDALLAKLRELVASVDDGSGVLVLADIFGATPCNVVGRLLEAGHVEGVAGVNLPMLLRVLSYREVPLSTAVGKVVSGGVDGVLHINSDPCHGKR